MRATTRSAREEGAADARFHLAIAEASHNTVLLHTIKGLFDLLRRNVVTNIGGMYAQRTETRAQLMEQHQRLYDAIISGQASWPGRCQPASTMCRRSWRRSRKRRAG